MSGYSADAGKAPGLVFNVRAHGAKGDGVADDSAAIRAAITAAVKAGPGAVVVLDAGRYRVSSSSKDGRAPCFDIHRANGVTIRGEVGKTELISTSPAAGVFSFRHCANVSLKGVTVDYDPLPFTQGSVTAVDVTNGTFNMTVDDGFPLLSEPWFFVPDLRKVPMSRSLWGVVFDRAKKQFKEGSGSANVIESFSPLGGRAWRVGLYHKGSAKPMAPGDAFVVPARLGTVAAFMDCNGATAEDVTIYMAPGLCVLFLSCEGELVARRVIVRPRPGTTRLISATADGVHCQRNRKGPLLENCRFEGMVDDGMNTYDVVKMVTEVISPTELRLHHTLSMRAGDRIQVMDPKTGLVRGEATLVSVADKGRITLDHPIPGVRTSKDILDGITSMTNHLDADVVFNLSTCGAGYVVRNNYFGNFRGRGLILKGVNGLIESNVFERTSGPGIVIQNEPTWPEGPVPRDVTIRGNRFNGVGLDGGSRHYGAIVVSASGLKGGSPDQPVKNIRIENNVIIDPPAIGMFIRSCAGVRLAGNKIESDGARAFPSSAGIVLADCSGVTVEGLVIADKRPKTRCGIEVDSSVAHGAAGIVMSGMDIKLSSGKPAVLDRRVPAKPAEVKK